MTLFHLPSIITYTCNFSKVVKQRRYNDWIEISMTEMKKFIGLIILIGVYKSNNEAVSEMWSIEDGRQIFNP